MRTAPVAPPTQTKSSLPEPVIPEPALAEILKRQGLPAAKAGIIVQQITTEIQRLHVGPLPPVEDFKGYDDACPGAARDIVNMAKKQQEHQHWMEKKDMIFSFLMQLLGLAAAVTLVGLMFYAGIYLAMHSHSNLAGAVLSGTGIVTVAGAFFQAKRKKRPNEAPAARPQPQPKPQGGQKKKRR
jgi:uncharacterized membrane protein